MSFDNLLHHPGLAGMRAVPQWIVWKLDPSSDRPGKTDKVPHDPATRRAVSAHKPSFWLPITEAVGHAQRLGAGYGVGFVFTPDCGYWFLDLDSCLQPSREWSPLAKQMFEQVLPGAAIEVSVSGKGLHMFGRGTAPPHGTKNNDHHAEFYTSGRFCAMTGTSLVGNCDTDHSAMLPWLVQSYFPQKERKTFAVPTEGPRSDWRGETDDEALIERMLSAPPRAWKRFATAETKKAAFSDLWTANVDVLSRAFQASSNSAESYDASKADAALAEAFAYETGCDVQRIERLMRRSSLAREKWDHRPDYLVERTIMFVCGRQERVRQDPPTPAEVLQTLRQLPSSECRLQAVPLLLKLDKAGCEAIFDEVEHLTLFGVRPLRAALKEGREAKARERMEKQIAERAGPRALIEHRPEARTEQAAQVEALIVQAALPGEYVSFGGKLCHVTTKALPFTHLVDSPDEEPPDAPQLAPLDDVAVLARIERVAVFFERRASDAQKPIAVPEKVIDVLLKQKTSAAPAVTGLVTHPIVLPDGEILSAPGRHERTGLYLWASDGWAARPFSQLEAAEALQRLREILLDGFEFATPLDGDVALAALFTGVQRRVLDQAPGLAVLAAAQSSGKTTLARRIYATLTGRDMPVMTFALDREDEVVKQMIATLQRGPAMVVFDNVPDGFSFRSGVMASIMTSASYEGRLLAKNELADVQTNTLFAVTGNNIVFGADEVSRWMTVRLAPSIARPEERRFANPDVVRHALQHREGVIQDVVGIVAGCMLSGFVTSTTTGLPGGVRFPRWDKMVRQPLLWAGASDVSQVFRANTDASESTRALQGLMWGLQKLFPGQWFKARDLTAPEQVLAKEDARQGVLNALETLGVDKTSSAKAVGTKLKALAGRVTEVDGLQIRLHEGFDSNTKVTIFSVQALPA